ncbi:MAG: EscU/YscU/HrcU family type III secretion system export apparatus switch protein [Acidimicrobiia bacterium]|nr:EscU/YscU/HrcU family type III secretion system export apparatus switch protein [Acidimicrobiia bacterium]
MAEDRSQKTEEPTPKRRREAREKGQIPKSRELVSWGGLLAALVALHLSLQIAGHEMPALVRSMGRAIEQPDTGVASRLFLEGLRAGGLVLAPLLLGILLLSVGLELAQVGFTPSLKRLKPDFKRLNVGKGLKRLFSMRSLWETAKAAAKIGILVAVTWPVAEATSRRLAAGGQPIDEVVTTTGEALVVLIRNVAIVGLALAGVDYLIQRRRVMQDIRMTRQEVREEHRQTEGDPHVRQAIRSRQMLLGRNRMIAAVGTADVVLVNPTHYAVALRYETSRGAPEVVAKGAGEIAARIRAEAEEHRVPIVSEPPLTRTLYKLCEVGQRIPVDLYEAVARVLAFVFGLRRQGLIGGEHRLPPALAAGLAGV